LAKAILGLLVGRITELADAALGLLAHLAETFGAGCCAFTGTATHGTKRTTGHGTNRGPPTWQNSGS
jgi:hypothetical protein